MRFPIQGRPRWARLLAELLLIAAVLAMAIPARKLAAWAYREYQSRPVRGDFGEFLKDKTHPLSLYGSATCAACRSTREYLREQGIPFNDLRIDAQPRAREEWARLGQSSVPVLVTHDLMWVGDQRRRLDAWVASRSGAR
ncbi:glutaredoxin family protein [Pelomonas sp. CA6]|uniref:glutaredoxin family protein n=1 Tax=Pelomonas sp. CA6 TaxID=2907999 RepID=UPI001F4B7087|nr:glutaredoxin family protein [Pelomonas sp. CA6]MCH7342710.1 glutaredoxin family protein [Pelomonas sp. CA6]